MATDSRIATRNERAGAPKMFMMSGTQKEPEYCHVAPAWRQLEPTWAKKLIILKTSKVPVLESFRPVTIK